MENVLTRRKSLLWDVSIVFSASILMAICAYIRLPLFFTPVPLVVQNTMALFLGIFLGPKRGSIAVVLLFVFAFFHLPVFSGGDMLATLGYRTAYCLAAYITGKLVEKRPQAIFSSILAGHLIILLCGSLFLSSLIGLKQAFILGFVPFIGVDFMKSILLAKLVKRFNNKASFS